MNSLIKFPNFKDIDIHDIDIFSEYFKKYTTIESEYNFTNFFMWKNYYNISYSIYNNYLLIICTCCNKSSCSEKDQVYGLQPIGPNNKIELKDAVNKLLGILQKKHKQPILKLKRVGENIFNILKNEKEFTFNPLRDHFDYVYKAEDLINLRGDKYNSKRNHINKFKKLYNFEFIDYEEKYKNQMIDLLESWKDVKIEKNDSNLQGEIDAVNNLIGNYPKLNLKIGLLVVDNKVIAFSMGEKVNNNEFVIHVEKANISYQGSYSMINNLFVKKYCQDTKFINREQDLGNEGLRKAKLSYKPYTFYQKYELIQNK